MDSSISNNLNRKALLASREFWEEYIKTELYNIVDEYMKDNHLTQTQLAQNLGVSKGYISQVLNGESDHRISKMVELALHCGKVPYIYFKDIGSVINQDQNGGGIFINFEELEQANSRCSSTGATRYIEDNTIIRKLNPNVSWKNQEVEAELNKNIDKNFKFCCEA